MTHNKVEERSRSVGCAITFHRASVIAVPAFAQGKKKEEERKEGCGEIHILYVPVSFRSSLVLNEGLVR